MTKVCLLFALICFSQSLSAQFTKILSQPPVTDGLESNGAAWVDYDNDGDDDLFVTTIASQQGTSSKDLLYNNNGDGTFTIISSGPLVSQEGMGRNSSWADYDNDGFTDVFIANQLETFLYKNSGDGNFTAMTSVPTTPFAFGADHQGGAWGDYNNDGFLDLFLASYKLSDEARNRLFTNNGDGTFSETTETNVVTANGYSMDPSWIDYDDNGTLDLFVPNYGGTPNFLYTNQGNSFSAITGQEINTISYASLGASWADYDNDGDFDVLIPNNVNSSNVFLENNGNGSFINKSSHFGSTFSASASWADFDNDGHIDVMLAGGVDSKTSLFKNNGNKTFSDVTAAQGVTNMSYATAVASADYDRDGFIDIFIANGYGNDHSGDDVLYHNTPNGNHWVQVKLIGTTTNRSAVGAIVRVNTGTQWQSRTIQSKTGASAQNSMQAHFGLGHNTAIDRIVVEWPGKGYQELIGQSADQFITITEIDFPLPPEHAQATAADGQIEITWADISSDETGYRIERSSEGLPFLKIGEAAANTTSFTDNTAAPGDTYTYRVAAMTSDGYSTFSKTESVLITGLADGYEKPFSLHPNPVADYIYLNQQENLSYPVRIIDAAGRVVKSIYKNAGADPVSVAELPPGLYIVATAKYRLKMFKK